MFYTVCALPSPTSAEACASLFDRFTGTTAQSDFSSTCVSAVWLMAFADRPSSLHEGGGDLPVLVHVVSQRARVLRLRRTETVIREIAWLPCCLPPSRKGIGILIHRLFEAQ